MDIALAVEELVPQAKYRQSHSYAALKRTWWDERPVPSETDLEAAWLVVEQRLQDEAAREEQLEQDRSSHLASPLDVSAYDTESATIQTLAQKVAWLEREIADLRGA